jgi:phage gp16-like protein
LKMFPYDNDEFDEEERALNAQIKVGCTVCHPVNHC